MTKHFDVSHKDKKYFIDERVYNCPFCNRRNVKYIVKDYGSFSWSNNRKVYFYTIKCEEEECQKVSFHLSNYNLNIKGNHYNDIMYFESPAKQILYKMLPGGAQEEAITPILDEKGETIEFDKLFFHHQPTSFFTLDERIPLSIREPLSEAENCRKNNYLTGGSGCLRKAIYKLLKHENISLKDKSSEKFYSYEDRIDLLKKKYPNIDPYLFNDLKSIQGLTSQELHENDWEDFNNPTLHLLLEVTKELLIEIYLVPDERKARQTRIAALKEEANPLKTSKSIINKPSD